MTPLGTREVDLDTVTQFLPRAVDRAFLNHLKPNFNYSCLVLAKEKTRPLLFSTQYAGLYAVGSYNTLTSESGFLFIQPPSPQNNQLFCMKMMASR